MSSVVAERAGQRLVMRVRELRGEMTLSALARSAGIRQDELGKIERGETASIRFDTVLRLCAAFRVPPADLFAVEPTTAPVADSPLAGVLAGFAAGTVTGHVPARGRRRLADSDVFLDPSGDAAESALARREDREQPRRRRTVPPTVTDSADSARADFAGAAD